MEKLQEALDAIVKYGGVRAASRATGTPYTTLQNRWKSAIKNDLVPTAKGEVHIPKQESFTSPGTYIFTCAQNNTHVNKEVWENIKALASWYSASIYVSTFTYDLASYPAKTVKRGKEKKKEDIWYDPEIMPYILDESVRIAPGLVWCGELNILPTAVRPLSGFESYTGRDSGIFPHVKISMESIASGKFEPTKLNYSTGTITQRNYIAKTAGFKASFHHSYGALLVEVDEQGNWFCRQLNADKDNNIYDLEFLAKDGEISRHEGVCAINWGDIHVGTISEKMMKLNWFSKDGILKTLRPTYQFFHDLLNFSSRNHHTIRNQHKRYEQHIKGTGDVAAEIKKVAQFLCDTDEDQCRSIVVDSNHDNAFERWLREADYRQDPVNAEFFLEAQLRKYQAIREEDDDFHLLRWAVSKNKDYHHIKFLKPDESFVICKTGSGSGIECGMHGHYGINGARGSLRSFSKMGRKCNVGHTHSVGIENGAYCAGVTGSLDHGYNVGPSSWSQGHIITYPNGKRAIINVWEGKWRA